MEINLIGDVAVVTGAGRGIGRDLVLRLAREGMRAAAIDVDPSGLETLGEELTSLGADSVTYVCDITDGDRVAETFGEIDARFGRIDLLVNNAGIGATAPVDELSEEAWRRCHDVNLTGTFLTCRAVIPVMKRQGSGRIVNAASFAAIVPSAFHAAYASSKAAVTHFTRTLAGELGPWGITVNAYAPGMVPTSLNRFAERPAEDQDRLLDTLTLRRWGSTEDIGNLICFLASEQASYITGTLIDISGGKLATQIPGVAHRYAETGDPADII